MGVERRGRLIREGHESTGREAGRSSVNQPKSTEKPFAISKHAVMEAFRKVKANQGGPGVDGCTIEDVEADLRNRLYVTWNRMSSGSYFPPPVKAVEVPKPHGGGTRMLGVPTVADRVAQTVVAMELEKVVEPMFHRSSYGYRPGREQLDAVEACRRRCFMRSWVLDCDIAGFFDNVSHDLIVKAVEANTDQKWVVLYVKRWLKAPLQHPDGTLEQRDRGTPQGSAISPLLANLFLHYAFDAWMAREFPRVHVPGVHLRQTLGAARGRGRLQRLPSGCQQRRDEEDESRRTPLAAAPLDHAVTRRARGMGQRDRARVAQLLRPVLPDRAVESDTPTQCLRAAVGSQEVQAAAGVQTSRCLVGPGHATRPGPVQALGVDERILATG